MERYHRHLLDAHMYVLPGQANEAANQGSPGVVVYSLDQRERAGCGRDKQHHKTEYGQRACSADRVPAESPATG
jgi:hypothetical protein